jgi:hypothetical protein
MARVRSGLDRTKIGSDQKQQREDRIAKHNCQGMVSGFGLGSFKLCPLRNFHHKISWVSGAISRGPKIHSDVNCRCDFNHIGQI